tara:strand:+ start:9414 stop:9827 length:414 start_codon:yes stop_codon:yes gene_type:complete
MSNLIRRTNDSWLTEPFAAFFDDFFSPTTTFTTTPRTRDKNVRVKDFEDRFEISLAAPGIPKEDFEIQLQGNTLSIGYKQTDEQDTSYFAGESFSRSWTVPNGTTAKSIIASHKDGVLTIGVKKDDSKKDGITIPIK